MQSEDNMDIPDEYQSIGQASLSKKPTRRLTMGLKNYSDIKSAYRKYQKQNFPSNHQYTFVPKTNSKGKKRPFQKFIKTQQSFLNNKNIKIQKLKTQISECTRQQCTNAPTIDEKSRRISAELHQDEVFTRLSRDKDQKPEAVQQQLFKPRISNKSKSIKRFQKVQTLLFQDAQRRSQQKKFIQQELKRQVQNIPDINTNTNDFVCKKVYQQFLDLVGEEDQIPPIVAISILSELFNVQLNPNKGEQNQDLCHKVLTYLIQSSNENVRVDKFWHFILAILGKENQNVFFTVKDQQNIYDSLSYFYIQRLTKEKKTHGQERLSFTPETLRSSEKLAQQYRQKVLTQISGYLQNNTSNVKVGSVLKIQDLYILDSIRRKAQFEAKKIEKQKKQVEQCSFRPSIERRKTNSRVSIRSNFSLSKEKNEKQKCKYHSKNESSKENQGIKKQLKKVVLKGKKKENNFIKDSQKTIMRMSIGRKMRQFSQNALNRGYPNQVGNWIQHQKKERSKIKDQGNSLKGYLSRERMKTCRA